MIPFRTGGVPSPLRKMLKQKADEISSAVQSHNASTPTKSNKNRGKLPLKKKAKK